MSALLGKRVVVTRAVHQASEFQRMLSDQGAVPLLYPCIELAPPPDEDALRSVLLAAMNGAFDWLILTSSNTVFALKQQLRAMEIVLPYLPNVHVAAVGISTAEAARRELGLHTHVVPDEYTSETLAETLNVVAGQRVLLPQSTLAGEDLSKVLSIRGALVTRVFAYQMIIGRGGVDLVSHLKEGSVDSITFTSASTVKNFMQRLAIDGGAISQLSPLCIACIGPKTAAVVNHHNFPTCVIAAEYTLQGLTNALEAYFTENKMGEPR